VRIDASNGELLAGGDSLMRGYWNRPDETGAALLLSMAFAITAPATAFR
jgi:long-subunit acyl-CoA synthetase (AMP-forming)